MRLSTVCGSWFACANIAVPDCDRIWSFVKFNISWLMSASRIRLSAAVRFVLVVVRFVTVCSREFWNAPIFARCVDTFAIALSRI